jgi:sugar/nucleoside kinase (ribokinase family)
MLSSDYILLVGGCNGEYILELPQGLEIGQKNLVESRWLIGGGGVNQTLRLLQAGFLPIPILPIGRDQLGLRIQKELLTAYQEGATSNQLQAHLSSEVWLIPHLQTRLSTIAIHQGERTIFVEKLRGLEYFYTHLETQLQQLAPEITAQIRAIAIGDIQADDPQQNPSQAGWCSRLLIDSFQGKALIFMNPGKSQLHLDSSFWQEALGKIDLLQLNILEARQLFQVATQTQKKPSLEAIINWLRELKINAAITCDRFGVLGLRAHQPEGIIFAPPVNLAHTVDTTGAGDAFGAALVAHLRRGFTGEDFAHALEEARLWAGYACGYLGGAANCPSQQDLEAFRKKVLPQSEKVTILDNLAMKPIVALLERIYA